MTDAARSPDAADLACTEFVDLVTAYLDGALPDDVRAGVEAHLDICPGCRTVLAQWNEVIRLAGKLTEADVEGVDPIAYDRIMTSFRRLRRR